MAEGVLGGLLGGEEQAEEVAKAIDTASAEAVLGADAFAAAITVHQAGYGPDVARETASFLRAQRELLRDQGRLLRSQLEQIHEEHHLRLSMVRGQRRGLHIRVALQAVTAVAVFAIAAGLCTMVYQAVTSHAVVVDRFETPPALASRGLSGAVVASGLLDTFRRLQAATRSSQAGLASFGAWASDIKIEVPETGLSIGEIDRLLHARLGHDVHIGGDLVLAKDGSLRLTVRGDDFAAKTFSGRDEDLDKLTLEAAEYAYGQAQPQRFATYLTDQGRDKDALAFLPDAFARAKNDVDRAALANTWGIVDADLGKMQDAVHKFRLAMSLQPNDWSAWSNLVGFMGSAEGEEAANLQAKEFLRAVAAERPDKRPELRMMSNPAQIAWDMPLLLKGELNDAQHNAGAGAGTAAVNPYLADIYGEMHDWPETERYLAASDPGDVSTVAEAELVQGYEAMDLGRIGAAAPALDALWKTWLGNSDLQSSDADAPCFTGLADGMAGRLADAEAIFKRFNLLTRCYAFHGDVLAHAGDQAGAERAWAEGVRLGPDLPWVYMERGRNRAARSDFAGADADFAKAHENAPHFADPLKYWGDALAARKQWKAALARYDEALQYAPHWTQLQAARDEAAGQVRK